MKTKSSGINILVIFPGYFGGVRNYFNSILEVLDSEDFKIDVFHIGKRKATPSLLNRIFYSVKDLIALCRCFAKYDLIHLNPSLDLRSLVRDGVFHFFAKRIFKRRTIVYFHGWSHDMEMSIDRYLRRIFIFFFNFDHCIVLSNSFKQKLINWGYKPEQISVELAMFDERLLDNFSIQERKKRIKSKTNIQLLFLSRIEKDKGIIESLETTGILSNNYPNINLTVAGDGKYLDYAKFYCEQNSINNVTFIGHVDREKKCKILTESDIMLFPTYYREGMPSVLVEAMAFGIPVITRPVGGISDIFKNGRHGFMTNSKDPYVFAQFTEKIINDKDLWLQMSITSHQFVSRGKFFISSISNRLQGFYRLVLN